ncbi:DUF1570 domain-containing protein [Tautonia plasticadhaerens]|uniref:DUF1570 domain-containing protein n=1 Tax=Tautonia plasticadhaerens TaxID=2527974 RepID=A0A518GXN6_9BACT|nr:DUF1570 domain-containing protein [Tautonia plasticadhaerens]QDV33345.1 hypothetical protein ElP_12160 [Tautonia plasticadhaerens]
MRGIPGGLSRRIAVIALVVGWTPTDARPEVVVFAEGGSAQLPAEVDGRTVRLDGPEGPVEFLREDFLAIEPGHWPEDDWPGLRDRALTGDAEGRYRAAWWALERGLTPEAVAMLRSAHERHPSFRPVAHLVSVLDLLDRPAAGPDLSSLRDVLPGRPFSVSESGRIVLLHQHDDARAADRLELLDRVMTTFYLTFSAQGFRLQVPPEKLVVVWFAEEADYLDYIRSEAGESFLTTRGYYHPTRRVVFVTTPRSRADESRRQAARFARLRELDRAEAALDSVPPGARFRLELSGERPRVLDRDAASRVISRLRREARREDLLQDLDRRHSEGAAAVHELVHQLVVASGLAPAYHRFPVWLHEGIAMQFEAFRGGRWAGLAAIPPHRLDQWRSLRSAPPIEPILRDEGFGAGYVADRYAAAWALVWFLRSEEPARFASYLDRLRNPSGLAASGAGGGAVSSFRAAMGTDLDGLRSRWAGRMSGLETPLDSATTEPKPD